MIFSLLRASTACIPRSQFDEAWFRGTEQRKNSSKNVKPCLASVTRCPVAGSRRARTECDENMLTFGPGIMRERGSVDASMVPRALLSV